MIRFAILMVFVGASLPVFGEDTSPEQSDHDFEVWWADLAKDEPLASAALLNFYDQGDDAVKFMKQHLKPARLSLDELDLLLEDLSSDEDEVWRTAFEKLDYHDPRLAMELEPLMEKVTESPERQRLVELMSGREPDSLKGQDVTLGKHQQDDGSTFYNFRARGSWWAEDKVERLNIGYGNPKKQWTRACRAISILEHLRTPAAIELLQEIGAGGHEDAQPTRIARAAALRLMRTKDGDQ